MQWTYGPTLSPSTHIPSHPFKGWVISRYSKDENARVSHTHRHTHTDRWMLPKILPLPLAWEVIKKGINNYVGPLFHCSLHRQEIYAFYFQDNTTLIPTVRHVILIGMASLAVSVLSVGLMYIACTLVRYRQTLREKQ